MTPSLPAAGGPLPATPHVREVLRGLVRDPVHTLLLRWNWKTALLSTLVRGAIFFTSTMPEGLHVAAAALGRDVLFRVPLGGLYGAVGQAFSKATPAWASYVVVMIIAPAIAHGVEFLVHWAGGTPRLGTAITASVAFSALSALFNLFLMRRGVLLVGATGQGFATDLRRMPRLVAEFVVWLPVSAARLLRSSLTGTRHRG